MDISSPDGKTVEIRDGNGRVIFSSDTTGAATVSAAGGAPALALPPASDADEGEVLTIKYGEASWEAPPPGTPGTPDGGEGYVLTVVSGEAAWAPIPAVAGVLRESVTAISNATLLGVPFNSAESIPVGPAASGYSIVPVAAFLEYIPGNAAFTAGSVNDHFRIEDANGKVYLQAKTGLLTGAVAGAIPFYPPEVVEQARSMSPGRLWLSLDGTLTDGDGTAKLRLLYYEMQITTPG